MGTRQNDNGAAFEHAVAVMLANHVSSYRNAQLATGAEAAAAVTAFAAQTHLKQAELKRAASAGARALLQLEPRLMTPPADGAPVHIRLQPDAAGRAGDVRDVVLLELPDWEIGVSAKHNHAALKHSRFSFREPFAERWLGVPATAGWAGAIAPVLARIDAATGTPWSALADKERDFYVPMLHAFRKEMRALFQRDGAAFPRALVRYLIGTRDFYKLMVLPAARQVHLQAFNLQGTLGRAPNGRPMRLPAQVALPTRLLSTRLTKSDTLLVTFDAGWQVTFRVHNGDSQVARGGLKLDVQLEGQPTTLYSQVLAY